ncbi:MAG: hypothetical protein EXQ69_03715 [Acidimicrobiia bacterium]|nr:hypothetical protein [Acidimicrobiia bacterium]
MNLNNCPYDETLIDAENYSGGSFLLSCSACGAEWEMHNSLVRRITEPDREAAAVARSNADLVRSMASA